MVRLPFFALLWEGESGAPVIPVMALVNVSFNAREFPLTGLDAAS